jgi:hypothetical protein
LQLLEEKKQNENETAFLDDVLPNLIGRYQEESLQQFILNSNDFRDTFDAGFRAIYRFEE